MRYTSAFLVLTILLSSCSVVKKNGYYQSKKYKPNYKELISKSKKRRTETNRKTSSKLDAISNPNIKSKEIDSLFLKTFANIAVVNLPTVNEQLKSQKEVQTQASAFSDIEPINDVELHTPLRNKSNHAGSVDWKTIGLYVLLLIAAGLVFFVIHIAGFHTLKFVFAGVALLAILLHLIFSSKSDKQKDTSKEASTKNQKLGKTLMTFAFFFILPAFVFTALDIAGLGAIIALGSVLFALVGAILTFNANKEEWVKQALLVFLNIVLNLIALLAGLIAAGY